MLPSAMESLSYQIMKVDERLFFLGVSPEVKVIKSPFTVPQECLLWQEISFWVCQKQDCLPLKSRPGVQEPLSESFVEMQILKNESSSGSLTLSHMTQGHVDPTYNGLMDFRRKIQSKLA